MEPIKEGFDVFLHDGEKAFGAVMNVGAADITIYIENGGEFVVPRSAIQDVHSEKVVLQGSRLQPQLLEAIRHAHNREDPTI